MRFIVQLAAIVAVSFAGGQVFLLVQDDAWLALAAGLVTAVVATLVYHLVVRWSEKRAVTELAARMAASGLIRGTLLGVALFSAVIGNIAFNGGYRVDGLSGTPGNAIGLFGFMAAAAVTEELLFRGVLFRHAERWTGTWLAFVLSAALFGAGHLLNPNADWWGAVCVAVAGGGMLTSAYIATRGLWLPIGLHFGWNFAASAIFSTEVSGNGTPAGLLDSAPAGNAWISGGAFGPEASVYTVLAGVLVTAAFLWLAHRRGRLLPMRSRAADPATA